MDRLEGQGRILFGLANFVLVAGLCRFACFNANFKLRWIVSGIRALDQSPPFSRACAAKLWAIWRVCRATPP
ncbi:MAG TPA: hypothetical protein PK156_35500 [Polyangium sp.]|nr:hypothetical protein [Polyangium sp.]